MRQLLNDLYLVKQDNKGTNIEENDSFHSLNESQNPKSRTRPNAYWLSFLNKDAGSTPELTEQISFVNLQEKKNYMEMTKNIRDKKNVTLNDTLHMVENLWKHRARFANKVSML